MPANIKRLSTITPNKARRLPKKTRRKSFPRLRASIPVATATSFTFASATLVSDPGVEDGVEHVHDEVDEHEEGSAVEDDALDRGVVAAVDCIQRVLPDAVPRKDRFRDDGPAHQEAKLQTHDRDGREHGVPQRVPEDDPPG